MLIADEKINLSEHPSMPKPDFLGNVSYLSNSNQAVFIVDESFSLKKIIEEYIKNKEDLNLDSSFFSLEFSVELI